MNHLVKNFLIGAAVGLGLVLAFLAFADGPTETELKLRQQVAEHITSDDLRAGQWQAFITQQQQATQGLRSELDDLRQHVDALLIRKPPAPDVRGFINSDRELRRRIEQLERAMWVKP